MGPVWKAEQRLFVVWVPAAWVAEPSTSLGRDLRVGVWSLSRSGGGFWVEVASWIRVKALPPEPMVSTPLGAVSFLEAPLW